MALNHSFDFFLFITCILQKLWSEFWAHAENLEFSTNFTVLPPPIASRQKILKSDATVNDHVSNIFLAFTLVHQLDIEARLSWPEVNRNWPDMNRKCTYPLEYPHIRLSLGVSKSQQLKMNPCQNSYKRLHSLGPLYNKLFLSFHYYK